MRDPGTHVARASKKQQGVFYTPADVADYMVREVFSEYGRAVKETHVLDPACGSGVYMRAMLAVLKENDETCDALRLIQNCLYGFDISALSVESACFVLLHDCFDSVRRLGIAPLRAWHLLRLNFAVVDALRVVHNRQASRNKEATAQREALRRELSGSHDILPELSHKGREEEREGWFGVSHFGQELSDIFPEVGHGFHVVVGNPPYAPIGHRDDWDFLRSQYQCLSDCHSGRGNLYPLFIEMSWRLAKCGRSAAGLVVPLSIAYRRGGQFSACRRAMMRQGGRWRFVFFDREPHALFGEDVKTRNAIVLRRESTDDPPRGESSTVETGPLRKWTSRSRHRLFSSIEFTSLNGFDVTSGVPKLDGARQAAVAARLMASLCSLKSTWHGIRSCPPISSFEQDGPPRVFLGSTAYNFLNVFRPHKFAREDGGNRLSENPVTVMEFADETTARQVFAILSSRLVFWWWHVNADGFHVPRWFVENIPFGRENICGHAGRQLAELGEQLWAAVQDGRILSLNGGRESIAYRPFACERERDMIDEILTTMAGAERAFCDDLREFVYSTIVVDEEEERRRLLGIELNRVDPQ